MSAGAAPAPPAPPAAVSFLLPLRDPLLGGGALSSALLAAHPPPAFSFMCPGARLAAAADHVLVDAHVLGTPALGDVDGDGEDELVVAVSYFFDRPSWPAARVARELGPGVDPDDYVAAGVVAKAILAKHGIEVTAYVREAAGVVEVLFAQFEEDSARMPPEWAQMAAGAPDEAKRLRVVCDYIAGMTDRYAVAEHVRLTGGAPSLR